MLTEKEVEKIVKKVSRDDDNFPGMTYEATHNVQDITRQVKILEGISKGFAQK